MLNEQEIALREQLKGLDGGWVVVDFDDFKNFVLSGKEVLHEVVWQLKGDRLCYVSMDPANVALLIQNIEISSMSTHGDIRCGTDFDGFMLEVNHRVLELFFTDLESSKELTIRFHADGERARITLDGGFGSVDFYANIPCEGWPKVPERELSTKIKIGKDDFMSLVALAHKVAESVTLEVKDSHFNMRANGDLLMNLQMPQSFAVAEASGPDAKAKFSIEYLKRVRLNSDIWTLSFANDMILRIDDAEGNSFLLAPRVDNDMI